MNDMECKINFTQEKIQEVYIYKTDLFSKCII